MANPVCTKYKVAEVQAAPEFLDFDKSIAKSIRLIEKAVGHSVDQK